MKKLLFVVLGLVTLGSFAYALTKLHFGETPSPVAIPLGYLGIVVLTVWGFVAFRALAKARRELSILKDLMTQNVANVGLAHLAQELRSSEIEFAGIEHPERDTENAYKLFLVERREAEEQLLTDRDRFENARDVLAGMGFKVLPNHQCYLPSSHEGLPPAA